MVGRIIGLILLIVALGFIVYTAGQDIPVLGKFAAKELQFDNVYMVGAKVTANSFDKAYEMAIDSAKIILAEKIGVQPSELKGVKAFPVRGTMEEVRERVDRRWTDVKKFTVTAELRVHKSLNEKENM
jgi:hypothetical protein